MITSSRIEKMEATGQVKRKYEKDDNQNNGAWVKRVKRHTSNELDQCLKQLGDCLCDEGIIEVTHIECNYKLISTATKVITELATCSK